MRTFRRYTSIRFVVIILSLMCAGSWFTFSAFSSNDKAAFSSDGKASVAATPISSVNTSPSSDNEINAPAAVPPIFLADAEQIINGGGTVTGGVIHFWNITLGVNDTFTAGSPSSLTAQPAPGPANSDVDFPNELLFDPAGDLLVANGGSGNPDFGNFACVPAGAVTTGSNSVTVLTNNMNDPISLALGTDSSVALINGGNAPTYLLSEFVLGTTYTAAAAARDIPLTAYPGTGTHKNVVALPASAANPSGSYVMVTTNSTQSGTHIVIKRPDGSTYEFPQDASDVFPYITYDAQNNQVVAANNNGTSSHITFWSVPTAVGGTATKVKDFIIENDGFGNSTAAAVGPIAASPDGHIALAVSGNSGFPELIIYDNTTNRAKVGATLDYGATTTPGGATFVYGGSGLSANQVNGLRWLSNAKLFLALYSQKAHVGTSVNGLYIYDITQTMAQGGFDYLGNNEPTPTIKQTGFQSVSNANAPLAAAIRTITVDFADPSANTTTHVCNGNSPCYTTITEAIGALPAGGVVNVMGGTFNESVNLSSNVTVNINADTTVNDFTISAGTLTGGGGYCAQVTNYTLTLKSNWTNNGGTFSSGGGTVVFAGTGAQTIGGGNPTTFNNLTINNTSGVHLNTNETVGGALSLANGALNVGSNTLTINGATTKTSGSLTSAVNGTVNYNQSSDGQSVLAANYGNLSR